MSQHLAVELLSSYADKEVTPAELRMVEGHLSDCTECRHRLSGLRAIAAGVRRLESVAPPPTLSAAVERRVRLAALEEPRGFRLEEGLRRWLGQPVLAPVFAIVLALGAILYLFALGVSEHGRTTTRVIVASAPEEEDRETLGVPEIEQSSPGRRDQAKAVPMAEAAAVDTAGSIEQDRRGGVRSRAEAGQRTAVAAEPTPAALMEASFADGETETRSLSGRVFVKEADVWIEVGLEGQAAAELIDLRAETTDLDGELAAFRSLERVRLRVDDRIVEVMYPAPKPQG
ncbi:MAG: hypothetical protein GY769_01910 [bacterium]|nr:hypothetical protein [bacterium]